MNIGVLGTGDVGRVLATGFASVGDQVKIGTRDPAAEKAKALVAKIGQHASAGTFAEAAAFGETIVLATLWTATESIIKSAGRDKFKGKVVMDVTNPLLFDKPGSPPRLALGHTDSGGEQVQRWLPGASVVKVFNIVGNANMVNPQLPGGPPDMFLCGNDEAAKKKVIDICKKFGWPATDIGGIEGARVLEPMCILWVIYGFRTGSWTHAFKMLRK